MLKLKLFFISWLFVLLSLPLWAQQNTSALSPGSVHKYVINKVIYNITGRSSETSVRKIAGSWEGLQFENLKALKTFIQQKKMDILGSKDYPDINLVISEENTPTDSQTTYVTLLLTIHEYAPVFVIPTPKLTSAYAQLGLHFYMNNFLNTLQLFQVKAFIRYDYHLNTIYQLYFEVNYPIVLGPLTWTFDVLQQMSTVQSPDLNYTYWNTRLSAGSGVTFYHSFWNPIAYNFTFNLDADYAYHFAMDKRNQRQLILSQLGVTSLGVAFSPNIDHNFTFGDIRYFDNLKKGYNFIVENSLGITSIPTYSAGTILTLEGFYSFFNFMTISGRLRYVQNLLNQDDYGLDGNMRGLKPGIMYGTKGFFTNLDISFRVAKRLGDVVDIFLGLFFDTGFSIPKEGVYYDHDFAKLFHMSVGGNMLIYIYPGNVWLRISVGTDVSSNRFIRKNNMFRIPIISSGSPWILYIGTGTFY